MAAKTAVPGTRTAATDNRVTGPRRRSGRGSSGRGRADGGRARPRERMLACHAKDGAKRQGEPGNVEQQHDREVRRRVDAVVLLGQDDQHDCAHGSRPDQRGYPDPLPAATDRVDGGDIERAVPEHVDPDRHTPERGPGHEQRIVLLAVGVDHVDDRVRRPRRVAEVERVGDGQLLDVNEVSDEEQVDSEEREQDPVHLAATQGDDLAPGTRGNESEGGAACRGRAICHRVH